MEQENFDNFIAALGKYYELSMNDIAESIKKLADIQENFSKEYEDFKKIAENPELLLSLKINDRLKSIFFEMLLKSSTLTQKVNKLIILTPTEKRALAEDLKKYVQELRERLGELKNDE